MTEPRLNLPPELEAELRASLPLDGARRTARIDAIMGAVATMPAPVSRRWSFAALPPSLAPSLTRWRRRGVLAPAGALVTALMLTLWMGLTSSTSILSHSSAVLARAEVIGDTVITRLVARAEGSASSVTTVASPLVAANRGVSRLPLGDTMYRAVFDTIHDTMRIVRFALRAPAASQVALVHSGALMVTGLPEQHMRVARDLASGLWELRTLIPRDALARSFSFVIDDRDRVPVASLRTPASVQLRGTRAPDSTF